MDINQIKKAKTEILGKNIMYFETIPSTHQYAKEKAEELQDGTILIAEDQTAGIGTKDRKWYTKKGENIALTIYLKPNMKVSRLEGLTFELAKAMQEVMKENENIALDIKLPNDLIFNGKKVAGILTDASSQMENVKNLWISIGMNVNQTEFNPEIDSIATSLKKETNQEFSREAIIISWLEKVEKIIRKREEEPI